MAKLFCCDYSYLQGSRSLIHPPTHLPTHSLARPPTHPLTQVKCNYQGHLMLHKPYQKPPKSAAVGFTKSRCLSFGFYLNYVVWINFWDCFHDPRSSSSCKVMVILVIRLQFCIPFSLLFWRVITHIPICKVTYNLAWNMVMIKAILCAASLPLWYTATCYGIDEIIRSCWWTGDSKNKDSAFQISKPNKLKATGGSFYWFAASVRIAT